MREATKDYTVVAIEREELRVSRHGIAKRAGGRVLHTEQFRFPHTTYYLACEMVQDQFPNATVYIKQEKEQQ